jgi:hypothetical protein
MCAEVLVPGAIAPDLIEGAYVGSQAALQAFKALATGLTVVVDEERFF